MDTPAPPLLDPSVQQQPPPMSVAGQQAYSSNTGHGSAGPVIGVLAVITLLGVAAVMIGRLCSGRGIFGYGPRYDLESWVETKCSSCVDGRADSPKPRRIVVVERSHSNSRTSEAAVQPPPSATVPAPAAPRVEEAPPDDQEINEEEELSDTLSSDHHHPHPVNQNRPIHPLERDEGP